MSQGDRIRADETILSGTSLINEASVTKAIDLKDVFFLSTIIGVTGLWTAVPADTGSTVLVTLNALGLLMPVAK